MTTMAEKTTEPAVKKTITVKTDAARAFRVFTEDFDSWWPRSHHIGKSPMKRAILEGAQGGRCYTEHEDGTESDWGSVLVWDPPRRLVIAWKITSEWTHEPDLAKSSEVEVRFTPEGRDATRIDLEHRLFSRLGPGGESMRKGVDSEGGWGMLLQEFAKRVESGTGRA
jgi:uncharacterized protein YndB with AHSA1/START domain